MPSEFVSLPGRDEAIGIDIHAYPHGDFAETSEWAGEETLAAFGTPGFVCIVEEVLSVVGQDYSFGADGYEAVVLGLGWRWREVGVGGRGTGGVGRGVGVYDFGVADGYVAAVVSGVSLGPARAYAGGCGLEVGGYFCEGLEVVAWGLLVGFEHVGGKACFGNWENRNGGL